MGELGDHTRRSSTRRIYLYLSLFVGVVGTMIFVIALFSGLLDTLMLRNPFRGFLVAVMDEALLLFLFTLLLVYHLLKLRGDSTFTEDALAQRQLAFPVLVLDRADGVFGQVMTAAMKKNAPGLPVEVSTIEKDIPVENRKTMQAVILSVCLLANGPAGLRKWLENFEGQKILVAEAVSGWVSTGLTPDQAAQAARQVAEGQQVHISSTTSPGMIVLYTLLGLVVLVVLLSVFEGILYLF